MSESFSGTLTPNVVTTVTFSGVATHVTVRADGTDSIWFTVDGSVPTANNRLLPRAAQGETTVDATEDDPTVVKLISPGAVSYRVTADIEAAQSGATVAPDYARWYREGAFDGDSDNFDYTADLVDSSGTGIVVDSSAGVISGWGWAIPKVVDAGWYSIVASIEAGGVASLAIKAINAAGDDAAGEPWMPGIPDFGTLPVTNRDGGFVSAVMHLEAGQHIDLAAAAGTQDAGTRLHLVIQRIA